MKLIRLSDLKERYRFLRKQKKIIHQKCIYATLLQEIVYRFHVKQNSFSLPLWRNMKGSHLKFFFVLRVLQTKISSWSVLLLHWKTKLPKVTIRPPKHLFGSQVNASGNRAGASVQGHFSQMDLALESPATASSLHLYVNAYLHAHRHTKRRRQMMRWRTSLRNLGVACRCLSVWSLWSGWFCPVTTTVERQTRNHFIGIY